ncbi:MAG: alpha-ketoacid dehydrogenase subunit beta [Solirubrobacteraceae bacterium]
MPERDLTFAEAIREALDIALADDPSVYLIGEGVPDPKSIFGTTKGLLEKYGGDRVLDMPLAENGMTGVTIGSAITGMRPVLTHQRLDFALLSIDQIVNNAAKWHYMFGGRMDVPLVIRMLIGRGWGQGPQHSQSLQSWFAHVPGLKVVMPAVPADAKGLMLAAIADPNPVIYLEHRWLHNVHGPVAEGRYETPIGEARIAREGDDVTIVGSSYIALEAIRAAEVLAEHGVDAEVIDLRSVRPLDIDTVLASVRRTGRLVVCDDAWPRCGVASEVVASVCEAAMDALSSPPARVTFPDHPTPTSHGLSGGYYPTPGDIVTAVGRMLDREIPSLAGANGASAQPHDVPDPTFTGPF